MSDAAISQWRSTYLDVRDLGPDPEDEVARVSRLCAEAARTEEQRSVEREVAAARLGLPVGSDRQTVFRRVEVLINHHPDEAEDFWNAAYDVIPPLVNALESTLQQLAECEARLRSLQDAVKELAWPGNWDRRLCPIWKAYGGSGPSAAAWAVAGWQPDLVMLAVDIPGFDEVSPFGIDGTPLKARLTATDVPSLTESIRSRCSGAIAALELDLYMEALTTAELLRGAPTKDPTA